MCSPPMLHKEWQLHHFQFLHLKKKKKHQKWGPVTWGKKNKSAPFWCMVGILVKFMLRPYLDTYGSWSHVVFSRHMMVPPPEISYTWYVLMMFRACAVLLFVRTHLNVKKIEEVTWKSDCFLCNGFFQAFHWCDNIFKALSQWREFLWVRIVW